MPGIGKFQMNTATGFFTAETLSALRLRRENVSFPLCAVLYVRQAGSLSLLRAKEGCFPAASRESLRQAGSLPDNAAPLRSLRLGGEMAFRARSTGSHPYHYLLPFILSIIHWLITASDSRGKTCPTGKLKNSAERARRAIASLKVRVRSSA